MKFFNTAGPCLPERHYMLPAEARLPQARELIEEAHYFVVPAPRQTGKTTTLAALARALTAEGEYVALRISCEAGQHMGDDYQAVQQRLTPLRCCGHDYAAAATTARRGRGAGGVAWGRSAPVDRGQLG